MIKHTVQLAKNECGIACLKMFYDLFEVEIDYLSLLEKVEIDEKGVSIDEMLKVLQNLSLFKAYEIENEKLKTMTPSIVLLSKKDKKHFVVIWKYENGYFYISDPNEIEIKKIKEEKLFKYFSSYIIFNQKREITIPNTKKSVINFGGFKIPYILLSLLEVSLITFSMLYLFSIKDYTAIKIYKFMIILFINCIISLFKNLCLNNINKNLDDHTFDKKINDNFMKGKINTINSLKNNIKEGYDIKGEIVNYLSTIVPQILIIIGSLIYFFFINFFLFLFTLIIYLIMFIINIYFSLKKNNKILLANDMEMKLYKFDNKILTKSMKEEILDEINKIKRQTSKITNLYQTSTLVNFAMKQFFLMFILIFMNLFKIEIYSIFVITFYFYSIDGLINVSEYIIKSKERKIKSKKYLSE